MSASPLGGSILDELAAANLRLAERFPGEPLGRQPVHTVYGGAHLFRAETARRLGELALASLDAWAPDPFTFARAVGMEGASELPSKRRDAEARIAKARKKPDAMKVRDPAAWLAVTVYDRVREKLAREPVEDFRIDFEDGFGVRAGDEEDRAAIAAAEELARGLAAGTLPPFVGIRVKALDEATKRRSARTLELFFTTLVEQSGGALPPEIRVTLPKVAIPEQARALARLLDALEAKLGIAPGALKIELMIELTQSFFDAEGRFSLPRLLDACDGRCAGAHFGTYDYTASCGVAAAEQTMTHPAAQLALGLMKIAYAGRGIALSDGATNVLPVGVHRAAEGEKLGERAREENRAAVHAAWALSYRHIQGSLRSGFYQGWDLHPAQLPVRYAATYAFFLRGLDAAAARLSRFVEKAAQATLVGDVFDDAATGQGLLNHFLRAWACGAVTPEELAATGLSADEIATRSFTTILAGRARG